MQQQLRLKSLGLEQDVGLANAWTKIFLIWTTKENSRIVDCAMNSNKEVLYEILRRTNYLEISYQL